MVPGDLRFVSYRRLFARAFGASIFSTRMGALAGSFDIHNYDRDHHQHTSPHTHTDTYSYLSSSYSSNKSAGTSTDPETHTKADTETDATTHTQPCAATHARADGRRHSRTDAGTNTTTRTNSRSHTSTRYGRSHTFSNDFVCGGDTATDRNGVHTGTDARAITSGILSLSNMSTVDL